MKAVVPMRALMGMQASPTHACNRECPVTEGITPSGPQCGGGVGWPGGTVEEDLLGYTGPMVYAV